ncbi:hypothetical protein P7K49_006024 [Saguinus oedipus]|uniref:Uncharacterized protein n=1 Tax=Saguinus oedipus TaxID=9490 RepID=A0ABQ9W178_SAGOE|nr:hypothetical protein P7K49_006024 [Saguinus oedipus]
MINEPQPSASKAGVLSSFPSAATTPSPTSSPRHLAWGSVPLTGAPATQTLAAWHRAKSAGPGIQAEGLLAVPAFHKRRKSRSSVSERGKFSRHQPTSAPGFPGVPCGDRIGSETVVLPCLRSDIWELFGDGGQGPWSSFTEQPVRQHQPPHRAS